jgi:diadenosine tetraphosphate (Ap4A) HIT family hydrolase
MTDLSAEEWSAIWTLVGEARASLDAERRPDGYNLGINDGVAAGQTVMHLHVHLIPRYAGDRADPRGVCAG